MELTVHQQIYYSNKELVPIKDVAESLLALEAIIRQSPDVLEAMFPGTKIQSVEVYIKELKSDSIWEDVIVKFIFGNQQKFDEFIANVRERIGMDNIMNNPQLLSSIILVMVLSGGAYYLGKDKSATPEQKATIEANNNTIIQIGAGMVELSSEDFKAIIDASIKDKEKLAKNAIKVVNPAKRDPEASITFNDNEELRIQKESVKAMPRFVQEPEDEEYIEDYMDIQLEIRAIDLDSTKRGWAVVVPDLHKKRVRLQLDPTVNPEDLLDKRKVNANITVIFGHDKEYNKVPKLVFLREIITEISVK
ncbi:hypothetical protein [Stutzerimonas nitrititolerans]|uniref:hypothetical protein n=1 Tax=Stutzerimonas nitrititolerans TaxID=2482751 RepID=UPI0028A10AE0|nr:hypothetical protein [Stutzerimonas nitrititolerans]